MNEWVLIVAMLSPTGEFLSKYVEGPLTKAECYRQAKDLEKIRGIDGSKFSGVCVTKLHWQGKKFMPNMPLD